MDEFVEVMQAVMGAVNYILSQPLGAAYWEKATGGTPEACPPIFSIDNPTIHTHTEVLAKLGLVKDVNWLKLPAYSGDLHRTIERVHARICGAFMRWLYDDRTVYSVEQYCKALRAYFLDTQVKDLIQACMSNLDELYARVIELKGGLPEKAFR